MEVLYTSPWVPVEWIEAHGIAARGVWAIASGPAGAVPEGVCAFAQAVAGVVNVPSASPIILTTACDQMRRGADALATRSTAQVFLFNLPATWQSQAARRIYHAELDRLGRFLVALGGHTPTAAELDEVIDQFEKRRESLRAFCQHTPARKCAEALAQFFHEGSVLTESPPKRPANRGVPLAIVGGPLLPCHWSLFDTIECAGGNIVLNATEPGERCLLPPLRNPVNRESPMTTLVDHYFDHILDVFPRPNSRLYSWLAVKLAARKVRGIILWAQVGCDLWRAEAASLREAFGLPVLAIDSQGLQAGSAREATRIGALIESLQ